MQRNFKMPLILLLLCGVCTNVRLSAAEMTGGQALTEISFPESVFIQNKAAPYETLCLGSIFNSFTVFTADTCALEERAPNRYRIIPSVQVSDRGFDAARAIAFDVKNITTYKSSNLSGIFRVKIVRIGLPGFVIPVDGTQANYVTTWDDIVEIIVYNRSGIGAAMSSIPPKAGAIHFEHPDTKICNSTYAAQREATWPIAMQLSHFCIFESDAPYNSSNGMIVPGMPCEDSVGSPIFTSDKNNYRTVIGILLVAQCRAATPFAIAINSAEFTTDLFYTPTPSTPQPPTTEFIRPTPQTTRRTTRRRYVVPNRTPQRRQYNKSDADAIVVSFPMWFVMIFAGVYLRF